jgi:hypothetical protein
MVVVLVVVAAAAAAVVVVVVVVYCDGIWSIARQRVAEYIFAATNTQATEELPFLYNSNLNTPL